MKSESSTKRKTRFGGEYFRILLDPARDYSNAWDSDGTRHGLTSLWRQVLTCSRGVCEVFQAYGLSVTRGYLEKYRESGIRMKVAGRSEDAIVSLTGQEITAFLREAK